MRPPPHPKGTQVSAPPTRGVPWVRDSQPWRCRPPLGRLQRFVDLLQHLVAAAATHLCVCVCGPPPKKIHQVSGMVLTPAPHPSYRPPKWSLGHPSCPRDPSAVPWDPKLPPPGPPTDPWDPKFLPGTPKWPPQDSQLPPDPQLLPCTPKLLPGIPKHPLGPPAAQRNPQIPSLRPQLAHGTPNFSPGPPKIPPRAPNRLLGPSVALHQPQLTHGTLNFSLGPPNCTPVLPKFPPLTRDPQLTHGTPNCPPGTPNFPPGLTCRQKTSGSGFSTRFLELSGASAAGDRAGGGEGRVGTQASGGAQVPWGGTPTLTPLWDPSVQGVSGIWEGPRDAPPPPKGPMCPGTTRDPPPHSQGLRYPENPQGPPKGPRCLG